MYAPRREEPRPDGAEAQALDILARRYAHRVDLFVRQVSSRYRLGSRWRDDLLSAGNWGLFKALRNLRADASEHERSAYISQRIVGAVIDEARQCLARANAREVLADLARESSDTSREGLAGGSLFQAVDPGANPEEHTSLRMRESRIDEALETLDATQRRVLRAYMAGFSVREIAEREAVPLGTMRTRFQRLARELRGKAPHIRRVLLDLEPHVAAAPPAQRA